MSAREGTDAAGVSSRGIQQPNGSMALEPLLESEVWPPGAVVRTTCGAGLGLVGCCSRGRSAIVRVRSKSQLAAQLIVIAAPWIARNAEVRVI